METNDIIIDKEDYHINVDLQSEIFVCYIPDTSNTKNDIIIILMNELIENAGFDIRLSLYEPDKINELIASEKNSVFITPYEYAEKLISNNNLVGNFKSYLSNDTKEYAVRASIYNEDDKLIRMPTSENIRYLNPAILVRNDIYRSYGKKISDANEYELLLNYISYNYVDEYPSITVTTVTRTLDYINTYESRLGCMAFDLFLPLKGYTSLESILLDDTPYSIPIWFDMEFNAHLFIELGDAKDALLLYQYWFRLGYMIQHFGEYNSKGECPPTILGYASEIVDNLKGLDLTQYTLNVFHEPENRRTFANFALAKENTDVAEFFRFMEWLCDYNNYLYLCYRTDKELDDYNLTLTEYHSFSSYYFGLKNHYATVHRPQDKMPQNYYVEIEKMPSVVFPILKSNLDYIKGVLSVPIFNAPYRRIQTNAVYELAGLNDELYGNSINKSEDYYRERIAHYFNNISKHKELVIIKDLVQENIVYLDKFVLK